MSKKNPLTPRPDQYVYRKCPACGVEIRCMIWDPPKKCDACILKEVQAITNHPLNTQSR